MKTDCAGLTCSGTCSCNITRLVRIILIRPHSGYYVKCVRPARVQILYIAAPAR